MNSGPGRPKRDRRNSRLADSVCLVLNLDEALAFGEHDPQTGLRRSQTVKLVKG
jgi:hypothetical protein